jgi:hypothetical protein
MLWKCLEIMCDFIFHFFAAMAQQQVPPFPQPPVGDVRPPQEPLPYVLPELFDETIDRAYRSYHSTICGAELGSMRFRGPGHYMSLHPGWCPKYVIRHLAIFVFPHFILWCKLRTAGLLPLARLVEGGLMRAALCPAERRSHFGFELPAGLRGPRPVAPRDAQLPLPLGGDRGDFGRHG